jgi:small subunit ribosomal protein S8
MLTDQIADMLTRIRNACKEQKKTVTIPSSGIKKEITRVLHEHHFISKYAFVDDDRQGLIKVLLKYDQKMRSAIQGIRRISTPGRRVHRGALEMPKVYGGMGIAIISTPKGIMTDQDCRKANVGGEVIAYVW